MLAQLFEAIENSGLGQLARSSVWLYPSANLIHVLGAALLVGSIIVFDVLLLRRRYETARAVSGTALTVAALGIVLQIASGSVLFSAEATAIVRNPVFLIKMVIILVGLANIALYHASKNKAPETPGIPPNASFHAAASAIIWIGAALAGRAIAYV
jgi:hypothetical protein